MITDQRQIQAMDGIHQINTPIHHHGVQVLTQQLFREELLLKNLPKILVIQRVKLMRAYGHSFMKIPTFILLHIQNKKNHMPLMVIREVSNGILMLKLLKLLCKKNTTTIITINLELKILVIKESMKKFNNSPQRIKASSHNHGEEQSPLTQLMDSKTHHGTGLTRKLLFKNITTITIKLELWILVTKESMKKFNNSPHMIRAFSQNHGEDQRPLIHLMDSETQHGNGLINQKLKKLLLKNNTTTIITIKLEPKLKILVTKVSMRKFNNLPPTIRAFSQDHGEEQR